MRVAGVLKDWILIALSTVIFPESTITGLNIIGYAIGLFLFLLQIGIKLLNLHVRCIILYLLVLMQHYVGL